MIILVSFWPCFSVTVTIPVSWQVSVVDSITIRTRKSVAEIQYDPGMIQNYIYFDVCVLNENKNIKTHVVNLKYIYSILWCPVRNKSSPVWLIADTELKIYCLNQWWQPPAL